MCSSDLIEIDDDAVDVIIQNALVRDYVSLMDDIKQHNKYGNHLHEDDYEAFQETAAALKVLGNWYFIHGEFDEAVKKAQQQKF